jgi:hypothetical protein
MCSVLDIVKISQAILPALALTGNVPQSRTHYGFPLPRPARYILLMVAACFVARKLLSFIWIAHISRT